MAPLKSCYAGYMSFRLTGNVGLSSCYLDPHYRVTSKLPLKLWIVGPFGYFHELGVLFVGVLVIRALLVGAYVSRPLKLLNSQNKHGHRALLFWDATMAPTDRGR